MITGHLTKDADIPRDNRQTVLRCLDQRKPKPFPL
jgi:hypothetical protein